MKRHEEIGMVRDIHEKLTPVQRRQQLLFFSRCFAIGMLASATAGIVLGILRQATNWSLSAELWVTTLLIGPGIGSLIGIIWRRPIRLAAVAVDGFYRLKDRAVTALAFLASPEPNAFQQLQVRDAGKHLEVVEATKVVPLRMPRSLPYAVGALMIAVALLLWPLRPEALEAAVPLPLDAIVAEAENIEEHLKEFEQFAKEHPSADLKELIAELKEKAEELKQPGVDLKEALAKMSDMQAALQAQQAQFNIGEMETQLASLGDAMSVAKSLERPGKALAEGKFEKAAEELEKLDAPALDKKEAKTLKEKLKKASKDLAKAGLGSLSESTDEMSESTSDKDALCSSAKKLAKDVRKCELCRKINSLLQCECKKLGECKGNCQSNCNKNGGNSDKKSNSPKLNWGTGTDGNSPGEMTSLDSTKNLEKITGMQGEGSSESETTHSPEGRQEATRAYRDVYQKYRRMSEAVLDSEPIPLGHRQTIRNYFELIRPSQAEEAAVSTPIQAETNEKSPAAAPSSAGGPRKR